MAVLGLPFDEVIVCDTEFRAVGGNRPEVHCLVARELGSGRVHRLWADEFGPEPPFRTDAGVLFVAYYVPAELGCFRQLGWSMPERILDLFVEFRVNTNGLTMPLGNSLLAAMSHHGLAAHSPAEKADMRALSIRGGPFTARERADLLDYCQSDTDALGPLLERLVPHIQRGHAGLSRALFRGRYMAAVSAMEYTGIPIDVPALEKIRSNWDTIKLALVEGVDALYDVYKGTSFRSSKFQAYLRREGIAWPLLDSGGLALDDRTFKRMAEAHPQIQPLRELRHTLGQLRLEKLAVGDDGRNRVMLSPFGTGTGRNNPRLGQFVFGNAKWIRHLIVPPPGMALAYVDYASQEPAIAAHLSGDADLQQAVRSGDPYMALAVLAGLAPPGSTKATHPEVRARCKPLLLGSQYGQTPYGLAATTGMPLVEARDLHDRLRRAFPRYFQWSRDNVDRAQLLGYMETTLGWRMLVPADTKPTALLNWPLQSTGADVMRLAACMLTEAGIDVCCPVHDAFLVMGPDDRITEVAEATQRIMGEAAGLVLDGCEIGTDVYVVRSGERYREERGAEIWDVVRQHLD